MNPRKIAIIVGSLFLIALFSDIISVSISENKTLWIMVMFLDLISGVALIGIGVTIFPILKQYNKNLARGYTVCRIFEGIIFIFMGSFLLFQMTTTGASSPTTMIDLIYVYIFGLGALILYYLLYQSKLVPRLISIWGFIAIIMLLVANSLGILSNNSVMTIFLATPIILNEMVLAVWLIVKGFNPSAIASGSAKTDINEIK